MKTLLLHLLLTVSVAAVFPLCPLGECPKNFKCTIAGKCVPVMPTPSLRSLPCTAPCPPGTRCEAGACVGIPNHHFLPASNVYRPPCRCPRGYYCRQGRCIRIRREFVSLPCTAPCPPGTRCEAGACVGIPNFLPTTSEDIFSKTHFYGPGEFVAAFPLCPLGECPKNFKCTIAGKCVPVMPSLRSLPCTAPCPPGTRCENGACVGIPI